MHELNEDIRDREIRLIGEQGEQLGIMSAAEALEYGMIDQIFDGRRR